MIKVNYGYIEHTETESSCFGESVEKHSVAAAALFVHEMKPEQWEAFSVNTGEDVTSEVLLFVRHLNAAMTELRAHSKQQIRTLADKKVTIRNMGHVA